MNNIKVYDGSIFYVDDTKRNIIKHNIVSEKSYVYYKSKPIKLDMDYIIDPIIKDYYIFGRNTILLIEDFDFYIFWNGRIIVRCAFIDYWSIVCAEDSVYFYVKWNNILSIYNSSGVNYQFYLGKSNIAISQDGQKIVIWGCGDINITYMSNSEGYNLFENSTLGIKIAGSYFKWINNSSRFIIGQYCNLIDTYTWRVYKIFTDTYDFFDLGYVLIHCMIDKIILYDPDDMSILNTIHCVAKFVAYHSHWKALITAQLEYYCVTPKYELRKFKPAMNYLHDMVSNPIMDMILFNGLLFELLPDEILYTNLYKIILTLFAE